MSDAQALDDDPAWLRGGASHGRRHDRDSDWREIEIVRFADLAPRLDGRPLVRGVLEREQISVMVGEPGCGKTFAALDLALSVAAGRDWLGHRVAQGAVVYVAAEAGRGIANRVVAWRQDRAPDDDAVPFAAVTTGVDLCHPAAGDLDRLIAAIEAANLGDDLVLVVIDTVSRVLAGGDENSAADMGALVRSLDTIRDRCQCHVLAVHHVGKDATRGPRGHSLLRAAADTVIEVTRDSDSGVATATATKQRDMPSGSEIAFRLRPVTLGYDTEGDAVTSCVVDPADAAAMPKRTAEPRLSPAQGRALQLLAQAIERGGEVPPASNHIPAGTRCVTEDTWRSYCYSGAISAGDQHARSTAFRRAAEALLASGRIGKWEAWVWPI